MISIRVAISAEVNKNFPPVTTPVERYPALLKKRKKVAHGCLHYTALVISSKHSLGFQNTSLNYS